MTTFKRLLKFIAIVAAIACICIVACVLYFVIQFSATYPHLKDYAYPVTAKQLEKIIINVVKSDTALTYIITDSTGTKKDRAYYMDLILKENGSVYSYHVTYKNSFNIFSSSPKCEFGLVNAFDTINKFGGYKEEDKNAKTLVELFDKTLISKINNELK